MPAGTTRGAGGGTVSRAGLPEGLEEFADEFLLCEELLVDGVLLEAGLLEEELSAGGELGAAA